MSTTQNKEKTTMQWLTLLEITTDRLQNLKLAIEHFTGSVKAFDSLTKSPKLFYRLCFLVYNTEKNHLRLWRSIQKDYDPQYFFNSIGFVPELEKVKFDAFKVVYKELYSK